MKRARGLWPKLISEDNIRRAIFAVNLTHRWYPRHKPNRTVLWVESTIEDRIQDLQKMVLNGFQTKPIRKTQRWDKSAGKFREISEPALWPDQYIHHMLIQVIEPVAMKGMDPYCCGSIKGRGIHYGMTAMKRWMANDVKGTKYCLEVDIHHFYDSIKPKHVVDRLKCLIKDWKVIDLAERIMREGVLIGIYTSQWFANIVLQPLDRLIRTSGCRVAHYMRYMDNFTILGTNKRKLHHLKEMIDCWLAKLDLKLNHSWQVYPTSARLPQALGYKYGRGYTLPRKRNKLRLTQQINEYERKLRKGKRIPFHMASSLLSRLGQLKHCNSNNFYQKYYPYKLQRDLKRIVREYTRKESETWSTYTVVKEP